MINNVELLISKLLLLLLYTNKSNTALQLTKLEVNNINQLLSINNKVNMKKVIFSIILSVKTGIYLNGVTFFFMIEYYAAQLARQQQLEREQAAQRAQAQAQALQSQQQQIIHTQQTSQPVGIRV